MFYGKKKTQVPKMEFQLHLHRREIYLPCTNDFKLVTEEGTHPVYYYHNTTELYDYFGTKYTSVTYNIYYLYNGAIGPGYQFFPNSEAIGFHNYDIERIRVLFDVETSKPSFVFFSAHANEGKWVAWDKCNKTDDGALKIYVAQGSHANYPAPGHWLRIFGFATDRCTFRKNGGIIIKPVMTPLGAENFTMKIENFEKDSPLKKRFFLTK